MASNFRLDDLIRRYPSWEKETGEIEYQYQSKQPCWDCVNACGGCEWADRLEPVPGWDATPTQRVLKCGGGRGGTRIEASFVIHSCPKFRRETR